MDVTQLLDVIQTAVIPAVLVFVGMGIKIYVQLNKANLTQTEISSAGAVASLAVQAGEEMGNRQGWTGQQKSKYAREILEASLPGLSSELAEAAVHGALVALDLGTTSSKKPASKAPKKKAS